MFPTPDFPTRGPGRSGALGAAGLACLLFLPAAASEPPLGPEDAIPFGDARWVLVDAERTEHLGRESLAGTAYLDGLRLEDGIVEVDVAVTGATSYPGVTFRMQSTEEYERVYLRPHRAGLYPDAVQYVPAFHGVDGWQLYHGEGYTAAARLPHDRWFRLRIEVRGRQARVFVGDSERPALLAHELERAPTGGTIGLSGPRDGSAYFSNVRVRTGAAPVFDPPLHRDARPGAIRRWRISEPFRARSADPLRPLASVAERGLAWKDVESAPSGLVDVSRHFGRLGSEPDSILALAVVESDRERTMALDLGYSDEVRVFLDGTPLFSGNSGYRTRDPSFLGAIGDFDTVFLPLRKGRNELLLLVTEGFGGWGFLAADGDATFLAKGVERAWETEPVFRIPESAAWDAKRGALFVSNYDGYNRSAGEPGQSISRLGPDGALAGLDWLAGVRNPTGLAVAGDSLWIVETGGVVEASIPEGRILRRIAVPGAGMLNDVAIAPDGAVFVSDSRKGGVLRIRGGEVEEWLSGPEFSRPNGLRVDGARLLVATNGDHLVKSVDLASKETRRVAGFAEGTIDGIEVDGSGGVLVSIHEGRIYRVAPDGSIEKLVDTSSRGIGAADFVYLPGERLLVVPTFRDGRVVAYRIPGGPPGFPK